MALPDVPQTLVEADMGRRRGAAANQVRAVRPRLLRWRCSTPARCSQRGRRSGIVLSKTSQRGPALRRCALIPITADLLTRAVPRSSDSHPRKPRFPRGGALAFPRASFLRNLSEAILLGISGARRRSFIGQGHCIEPKKDATVIETCVAYSPSSFSCPSQALPSY